MDTPPAASRWIPLLWALVFDLGLAGTYLLTWIQPDLLGDRMLHNLLYLLILEMVVVIITGMFGAIASDADSIAGRAGMFAVIFAMACLLAGGYAYATGSLWAFVGFAALTLAKGPAIVYQPMDLRSQNWVMFNWAVMVVLYLGCVFGAHLVELPTLGVTPEAMAAQEYGSEGGSWTEQPEIMLATGTAYFGSLALWALLSEGLLAHATRRKARHAAQEGQ